MAGTPKVLDAIATFKPYESFKIQAGQFKIPLSMENNTPSNNMEVIERAQVVEALVARNKDVIGNHNGRDIGVMAFGSVLKIHDRFIIDYYIGGFNGTGINSTDNNEPKDVAARIILHPVKGFDLGFSWYDGFSKFGTGTIIKNEIRQRGGAELSFTHKNFSVKGEYIQGIEGDYIKVKTNVYQYTHTRREGGYVQVSEYVLHKKIQLVARYDAFDPDRSTDRNETVNLLGGVNYFFNDWAKLQVNYTSRNETGKTINNDIIGAQLQIAF